MKAKSVIPTLTQAVSAVKKGIRAGGPKMKSLDLVKAKDKVRVTNLAAQIAKAKAERETNLSGKKQTVKSTKKSVAPVEDKPTEKVDLFKLPFPIHEAWQKMENTKFPMYDAYFADLMDADQARPDGWVKFGPHNVDVRTMTVEYTGKGDPRGGFWKTEEEIKAKISTLKFKTSIKLEDGLKIYLVLYN